ncbi:MAG: hypothetical protein ACTSUL_01105 [Promethearchaeota archaeon]
MKIHELVRQTGSLRILDNLPHSSVIKVREDMTSRLKDQLNCLEKI